MAMIFNMLISILLYISGAIFFIIGGILLILSGIISRKLLFKCIPFFCHLFMFSMGVRIKIKGEFPKNGPFVIMSNHGSFIDPFVVPPALSGEYTAIVAAKNYKIPLFASLLKSLKAVPVQRSNKEAAMASIKFAEKVIHSDGCHMVILPEGTRTLDGKLLPFKKGGFHMALNTQTPILLVVHRGTYLYKPKNRWTLSPRTIEVVIGPIIEVEGYDKNNINELLDKTWNGMNKLL